MATTDTRRAVGDAAARQLANTTKTAPQLSAITPRWLVQLLSWVPVESGTYRVNKVKNEAEIEVGETVPFQTAVSTSSLAASLSGTTTATSRMTMNCAVTVSARTSQRRV